MTGASFCLNVETVSIRRLGPAFSELMMRMGNLSQPMDEIGAALVDSTHHRFSSGIGPDGRPWDISHRAATEGGQTMVDSRRYENSITHVPTHNSVEVGSNLIYFGIHQFGGTIKAKDGGKLTFKLGGGWISVDEVVMPARPSLGVDDHDADGIEATIDDWLARPFH
ncbi:MAG: virion morphogenesis protein [Magnetospirillum sp.]|nr:MAG: virion morphogenesis protein [Magnetospirillum sp.]